MTDSFRLNLKSSPGEISTLSEAFRAFAAGHGLATDIQLAADLALEEIVANIIFHGYKGREDQPITVEGMLLPAELMLRVEDVAPPFNPLEVPAPDLTVPLDQRQAGGLGIHLIRGLMDGLEYRHAGGRNVLTMRKRLPPGSPLETVSKRGLTPFGDR